MSCLAFPFLLLQLGPFHFTSNQVKLCPSNRSVFALLHSFFSEATRIAAPDYIPNEADVLRARTKTTGIYDTRFNMGQLSIQ